MKRCTKSIFLPVVLCILIACTSNLGNENLKGIWQGTLEYPGFELRIVFKFMVMPDGILQANMLMPDNNENEIPASTVILENSNLYLKVASVDGSFEGQVRVKEGIIDGHWKQGFRLQPLVLKRVSEVVKHTKPQTPIPPYPYNEEDVTFVNKKANVELGGTLTLPREGCPCPAVILIPGVGAHDRDYSIMGHRPFLVLSDDLTRKGIAVLRFDERGVGASKGDRSHATSEDYAQDVIAGIDFLKGYREIDPKLIGLVGHSEGGTIASLAAVRSKDVAFIVMMGSPGLSGVDYNYQFEESMGRVMGLSEEAIAEKRTFQERVFDIVLHEKDQQVAKDKLRKIYEELDPQIPENGIQAAMARFLSPWFYFNLTYDPSTTLSRVNCPVLAIFGEKDAQVPPEGNAQVIKHTLELGGNKNHKVKVLSGLNHFFQTAESGAPDEYGQIEETISPTVLELIGNWILEQTQNPMSFRCTVFYASDGTTVLGGNNEDWSDPNTKFWFYPSTEGKHGWIKFGFAGGFPQGGMNDHGLFWDAMGCAYLEMHYSEANKEKYSGPLMKKVMEECASVQEARIVFENYYCDDQYKAQYLIGDKTGVSMIVEGDSIIIKSCDYQVATNFYHSHPKLGGYPCWRYDTAVSMLQNSTELSTYLFGSILSATHQEGRYPTQYSNIYDLKLGIIYLFHLYNFEEFIKINLKDELRKGNRAYNLPNLFSKIQIISPKAGEAVNPSRVTFKWKGKKISIYDLCYSTDPSFRDCELVPTVAHSFSFVETLFGALLIGILAIVKTSRKAKRHVVFILVICMVSLSLVKCKDEITDSSEEGIDEISITIENLEKNSTYYWKVIAHPEGNNNFSSESIVQNFSTNN